jgi:hypothetical protein
MSEVIEHELYQLDKTTVHVVRPSFGTQSDAWVGLLTVSGTSYPLTFLFKHIGGAILFKAEDVEKVDPPNLSEMDYYIVRLKGPQQYTGEPAHA